MDENYVNEVFQLCWDVIVEASPIDHWTFFNSEHYKILDTIDTNFDILENRLAYTYKYGCYNVLFFQKCFLKFLNECTDFETIFPLKKLKVCTLSTGPGFDIIGLLCALCISNKSLKSCSMLSAVSIFDSWLTLYRTLIFKACEITKWKFAEHIPIKSENINLIQGDVFSTLSGEAKKCISKSNVLLMVKVYFSSKTTVNKFANSLKKIFLLLKPGALIFFIGSDRNMNDFSRRLFLSNYVKIIYGPQKVTLDNIVIGEKFSNVINQKPVDSGHGKFVVWQKRNSSDIEALMKESGKKNKKKNKNLECTEKDTLSLNENTIKQTLGETVAASDCNYSSDFESELSYNSGSKFSDILEGAVKSESYSDELDSASSQEIKYEISSILRTVSQTDSIYSVGNVTGNITESDYANCGEHKLDNSVQKSLFQCYSDNASDVTNDTQGKFNTKILKDSVFPSLSCDNYAASFDQKNNTSPQIQENKSNVNFKFAGSTKNTKFPSSIQYIVDENAIEKGCIEKTKRYEITDQNGKANARNDSKVSFQENLTFKQTQEKLIDQGNNVILPPAASISKSSEKLNDADKPSLHLLIQRCENLVEKLQELTISIKSDINNSKKEAGFNKHCSGQFLKNSGLSHHCCCCVKIIHTCCCQKNV